MQIEEEFKSSKRSSAPKKFLEEPDVTIKEKAESKPQVLRCENEETIKKSPF